LHPLIGLSSLSELQVLLTFGENLMYGMLHNRQYIIRENNRQIYFSNSPMAGSYGPMNADRIFYSILDHIRTPEMWQVLRNENVFARPDAEYFVRSGLGSPDSKLQALQTMLITFPELAIPMRMCAVISAFSRIPEMTNQRLMEIVVSIAFSLQGVNAENLARNNLLTDRFIARFPTTHEFLTNLAG
jgi:hypothetical protein